MGVSSLPNAVTRQHCGCDLNPGPSAPESSTLTTRLPSHPTLHVSNASLMDEPSNQDSIYLDTTGQLKIASAPINSTVHPADRSGALQQQPTSAQTSNDH